MLKGGLSGRFIKRLAIKKTLFCRRLKDGSMASKWQTKVIKEYEAKGYFVINLIKTNKNGIPDLVALKDGEAIFIE